jgi:hypothetical protein
MAGTREDTRDQLLMAVGDAVAALVEHAAVTSAVLTAHNARHMVANIRGFQANLVAIAGQNVCGPPSSRVRIITRHIYPPIPDRSNDWCAYFDGQEETGNYGYGPTEQDAVLDLITNLWPEE